MYKPDLQLSLPMPDSEQMGTLNVLKHNYLVEADYDLSATQHKLIYAAISRINPITLPELYDPELRAPLAVRMRIPEVSHIIGMDRSNLHNRIDGIAEDLSKSPLTIYVSEDSRSSTEEVENPKPDEVLYTNWCAVRVNKNQGWIQLEFPSDVVVFLGNLLHIRGGYTSIKLKPTMTFDCKYSFRILEFLSGVALKHGKRRMPFKLILKRMKMLEKPSMAKWSNFERVVLKPALEEINALTTFKVGYKPKKSGRSVTHIDFTIRRVGFIEGECQDEEDSVAKALKGEDTNW